MKQVYPVIFTQLNDKKNTVLIEVPDLEILTEGFGMADAVEMARDAIGLACINLQDENKPIPEPTPIADVDVTNGTFAEDGKGIVSLVDVDLTEYRRAIDNKMVRRNVTLPNWLNREAEEAHINVSGVLREALMSVLGVTKAR